MKKSFKASKHCISNEFSHTRVPKFQDLCSISEKQYCIVYVLSSHITDA